MADSDLSTSISALKTKIVNGIPTANVNELVSLARAVKALNLGEDKSLEDAINARANALIGSASADDVARLAGAIKQVLNPASITVTTLSTITGDLIPDQNIVHDLGSSTNRFKDLHLSGNTAVIGDSKISDDGTGIDIRDTSGNPRTIKAKEVTIDDGTGNPIKMKKGAGNTIQFLDSSDNSIETQEQASAPAMSAYNLLSQLPTSGVNTGTQAYVAENNKLYLFNGTGWYNIALISNPITAVTGNSATYELDNQGSPTTITLSSSDPDGIPLQWSHQVTSGSLGGTTITNVNNVFTITPSTNNSDAGNFTVSFIATNGENQETSPSSFTLSFNSPYDLSIATSNTVGTTYYQHNRYSNTIHFSPDGTKMYENNGGNYRIYYAELSTAWDLSTAVRDESKTLSVGWGAQDIYLKPDGTVLYTLEVGGGVFEWHMSTAWDLDTAVAQTGVNDYLNIQTALGSGNQPSNIQFINGGSRLYVKATHTNVFKGFNLTTPWDITTATYASALDFTSGVFGGLMDMGPWKSDGTKFITHDAEGIGGQKLRIYTCGTAWDASTASLTQTLDFNNAPHSFTSGSYHGTRNQPELSADESKIYIFDKNLMGIRTFNFGTNWDLSTLTETPAAAAPNTLPGIYAASPNFSTDGTRFLWAGQSSKRIYQVDCSTPYDLSTSGSTTGQIYTREWSDGSNLETGLQFCTFKPDGTYVYFGGSGSSGITSIGLPTAWDLTSISTDSQDRLYVGSANFFGVGSNGGAGSAVYREDDPKSMVFKPDGTKFYVCGTQADKIHEFNCSIPWRVTNADVTYEHSFDPSTPLESGMDFSSDGTKMFVGARASQGKTIIEYTLSTPWNISTAVFVANHNPGQIGNMGMDLRDFNFNTDGTKLYAPQSGGASSVNYLFEFDMS